MSSDDDLPRSIRILCDQPSDRHPKKRPVVVVTSFRRVGDGWTEVNRSPYRQRALGSGGGLPDSGTTLVGDEQYDREAHGRAPGRGTRSVYELRCSKCGDGRYQYQQGKLFGALDKARHAGRDYLTLAELAAIVQDMARDSA